MTVMETTRKEKGMADLIYPLRSAQDALFRVLVKCERGSEAGRILVIAMDALARAEKDARSLTPFDPTGL